MLQLALLAVLVAIAFAVLLLPPDLSARKGVNAKPGDASRTGRTAPLLSSKRYVRLGAGLGILILLVGAASSLYSASDQHPAQRPFLAVYPFVSVGEQEPFIAAGITEELTTRMAGLDGLRVASLLLARRLAREAEGAASLGLTHVLEGSVSIEGVGAERRLRVRARLVDPNSGSQIWGEVYDEPVAGIFELEGRIANRIAGAMSVELGSGTAPPASRRTESFDAYAKYLQGIALRRNVLYLPHAMGALRAFEEAAALDPDFAGAWAGAASIHTWLAVGHAFANQIDTAQILARRAAELDPADLDVRLVVALQLWSFEERFSDALEEYRLLESGIEDFRAAMVGQFVAEALWRMGRRDEARAAAEAAVAADPLQPLPSLHLAEMHLYERRYADAAAALARGMSTQRTDLRGGRYAAILPILQSGDTAASWAQLKALGEEEMRTALSSGLFPDGRALVRIFAERVAGIDLTPVAEAAPAMHAGSALAKAFRRSADRPGASFAPAVAELRGLADAALTPGYRVRAQAALAVALAGAGQPGTARQVLDELEASLPNPTDPFSEHQLRFARAEVLALSGDVSGAAAALEVLLDSPALLSLPLLRMDPLLGAALSEPRLSGRAAS